MLKGVHSDEAMQVTRKFEVGSYKKRYGVKKEGENKLRIYGPYLLPEAFFKLLAPMFRERDYVVSIEVTWKGKKRVVEKSASGVDPVELTRELLSIPFDKINRISFACDRFEVAYEPEEIWILFKEAKDQNRVFKAICSILFGFMKVSEKFSWVEANLSFEISTIYSDQRRRGSIKCVVNVDGSRYGIKLNDFFI